MKPTTINSDAPLEGGIMKEGVVLARLMCGADPGSTLSGSDEPSSRGFTDEENQALLSSEGKDNDNRVLVDATEYQQLLSQGKLIEGLEQRLANLEKEKGIAKENEKNKSTKPYNNHDATDKKEQPVEPTGDDKIVDDSKQKDLGEDSFTLMIISKPLSVTWFYTLFIFGLQLFIILMILTEQIKASENGVPFGMPLNVSWWVRIAQFFAILLSVGLSSDIVFAIRTITALWPSDDGQWADAIGAPNGSDMNSWFLRVLFPNCLKFSAGSLILVETFILVVQSDNIIDIFMNFAAMLIIAELDDIAFWFAEHGFFGKTIRNDAARAKSIQIEDNYVIVCFGWPLRTVIMTVLTIGIFGGWVAVLFQQENGTYFRLIYPNCNIAPSRIVFFGDGICHGFLNTQECAFDGGDCIGFNLAYPDCKVPEPTLIGNGSCDTEYNIRQCNFDGGDCCPIPNDDPHLGDKKCNGGFYNTQACGYDHGDCDEFRSQNEFCPEIAEMILRNGLPVVIGDGICDVGGYNNGECGFEAGDCDQCTVDIPALIGNGFCNGGDYMAESCNEDGGDCEGCDVENPFLVGNGVCNSGSAYNNKACSFDGGDCDACNSRVDFDVPLGESVDDFCDLIPANDRSTLEACGCDFIATKSPTTSPTTNPLNNWAALYDGAIRSLDGGDWQSNTEISDLTLVVSPSGEVTFNGNKVTTTTFTSSTSNLVWTSGETTGNITFYPRLTDEYYLGDLSGATFDDQLFIGTIQNLGNYYDTIYEYRGFSLRNQESGDGSLQSVYNENV